MGIEDVLEVIEAGLASQVASLDEPFADTDDGPVRGDSLGADDPRFELAEMTATVAPTLETLSDRERALLRLRFVEGLSQAQIAERIGVSQMHVSRLLRRTLDRLHHLAEGHVDEPLAL